MNFYAYADNDPINGDDPFGLRTRVCCRPLRNAVFGRFLGFNHCYLVITSDDDQLQYHTYGLHREDPGNVPYPGGARPVPDDPTDVGGTCAEVPDATPCKERKLVQQSMSDTNCFSCGSNYSVLLTNSNYWVWDALKKAGMTPPTFFEGYWSPGYGELPPEAR